MENIENEDEISHAFGEKSEIDLFINICYEKLYKC